METINLLTWIIVVTVIVAIALSAMFWAYVGSGSTRVLFPDPLEPSPAPTDNPDSTNEFQQGVEAYRQGNYRRAVERFTKAINTDPALAEAHHNLGLALANLRQDNEAARRLAIAGELYLQQGNVEAIAPIKTHLLTLKARNQKNQNPQTVSERTVPDLKSGES